MYNINKFRLKVLNSKNTKKPSISLSIDDAEKLLDEIQQLQEQLESLSQDQSDDQYIELDGGTF